MRPVVSAYLGLGLVLTCLAALAQPGSTGAQLAGGGAAAAALCAALVGLRRHRPRRPGSWQLLALGLAFAAAASVATPFLTSHRHLTDLVFLPAYLSLVASAFVLVLRLGPFRTAGLEATIGALAAGAFLWTLVVEPNLDISGEQGLVSAVFPLCDLVVMMLILRVLLSPLCRLPAVRLLAAASTTLVVADVLYFSPAIANGAAMARVTNAAYAIVYVLFGAAALQPSMRRVPLRATIVEKVAPRHLVVVLAFSVLATPAAVAIDGRSDALALAVLGFVTTGLVVARIWLLLTNLDTLRLRAEASEQRFRMLFDSVGQGISIGSEGMMSETNLVLQQMLGYTGRELSELHYSQLTHPDDADLALEATDEVMAGSRRSLSFQKRLLRKDGSTVWVRVTITRAGDGTFGIATIEDVTARKSLEEELRHAQKMEAVGKLAGGIAHDFNNVMTAVTGSAELLMQEIPAHDPRRARVTMIAESAARATDLTRQLLAFSRRQVLRLEPLDLVDVVGGLTSLLDRLLPPNVGIDYDLARGAVARIDGAQFEQVLLNLALNARDAMPDGGAIRVTVRPIGDSAELVVADEGVGMDGETRQRIFDPFFTTKPSGTGLGLSTVHGIVGQSGGSIAVASREGVGTTFTVRLPLADEPAVTPAPAPPEPASTTPGRLLLADDEELVRTVTAQMLARVGYEVVQAATGEEALAAMAEETFDVLVSDVAMAGMDGAALAAHARELCPGLPVLFISGYPAEIVTGQRMVGEDEEVLTKPFTPDELAARVEHVRQAALAPA